MFLFCTWFIQLKFLAKRRGLLLVFAVTWFDQLILTAALWWHLKQFSCYSLLQLQCIAPWRPIVKASLLILQNGTGLWRKEICALIFKLRSEVSGLSDGVCVIGGGLEADPFAVAGTMTTSWRLLEDDKIFTSSRKTF
jgi:hypothetical protein